MNRHGSCRMCERVTEFRQVLGVLECIPCGYRVTLVSFVEAPAEPMRARDGSPLPGLQQYVDRAAQQVRGRQGRQDMALARNQMAAGNEQAALAQQQACVQRDIDLTLQAFRGQQAMVNQPILVAEIEAAEKRIAELEASMAADRERLHVIEEDAERRETLYGLVRNERDDLLLENARLRRSLESLARKGGVR